MGAQDVKMQKHDQEKAKFSLSGATLYGINAVIGSGIFLLPSRIYKDLGPASVLAMVAVGVLVMCLGFCYAEVSGYFSKNGGSFQYAKAAFGNYVGFNVGFLGWIVTIIAWSAMAAAFARILATAFPVFKGSETIISIALIIALSGMNILGIKTSKMFTLTITIAKLIPIFAFVLMSFFFIKRGMDAGNFTPFLQLNPEMSFSEAMSKTMLTAFYAFIGFETLSVVAGEMRNAKKNVPRAILGSISIVSVLYILILVGTIALIGGQIMTSEAPVQEAFVEIIGPAGYWIVSIGMIISILGLNVGESIMVPRFGASIADEGLLPAKFATKNKNGAPIVTIIVSCVIAVLLLLSGTFEQLAELSVVVRFFQYIPTALAVIWLRKKPMENEPVFKVPFGWLIPVIGIVGGVWMCLAASLYNLVFGLIGVVIASIFYFILNAKQKTTPNDTATS